MSNILLEQIYQVLGNLVQTYNIQKIYVDEDDQRSVIIRASSFAIISRENRLKYYSPFQLRFGHDIILLINIWWIRNKYVSEIKCKLIRI